MLDYTHSPHQDYSVGESFLLGAVFALGLELDCFVLFFGQIQIFIIYKLNFINLN